jgi:hypothetical protein
LGRNQAKAVSRPSGKPSIRQLGNSAIRQAGGPAARQFGSSAIRRPADSPNKLRRLSKKGIIAKSAEIVEPTGEDLAAKSLFPWPVAYCGRDLASRFGELEKSSALSGRKRKGHKWTRKSALRRI